MSSDDYFDDSAQLDSAFLAELDAIEAAHSTATQLPSTSVSAVPHSPPPAPSKPATAPKAAPAPIEVDLDESYDQFFDDIDPIELARLDKDVEEAYNHGPAIPRTSSASGSSLTRQLNLHGEVIALAPARPPRATQHQVQPKSAQPPSRPFGKKAKKIKTWDHTAFAKSGWNTNPGKSSKAKGKAKTKARNPDKEIDEAVGSSEEFEQFPAPKRSFNPPPPFKHVPDLLAAQTWIYPTNKPKRDYQYNIVRDSLFENSLVSLPTGLGKTFIAGAVMLNYYRWFPTGKVVFVAPTKPLVAQQIDACHKTCGIPGGDAAELTGQIPKEARAKAWIEKRVFFMTPQTLVNDLKSENCDATDIVLLVIDEAHKGTGNYAYAQAVRYLMARSAHFRILALTATPGAKPDAVQNIVDSLHISNVEIRDENSIDLKQYILPKKISTHIIKMTPDIIKVRDMFVKLMEKIAKRGKETGLFPGMNVATLHPYRCSVLIQNFKQDGTLDKFGFVWPALKKLGPLARLMGYLLECSISICHDEVHLLSNEPDGKSSSNIRSDPEFQAIVKELERQHNSSFSLHPKLDKLQSLTLDYFVQAKAAAEEAAARPRLSPEGEAEDPQAGETKMMVFTNFRSSVDEIVELLNKHQPLIRATHFIGQGTDKNGKKGITQKDQLEVIKKFKAGVFNVLVATSIGEEGLDIGEVDMIVCYDAQKTPIRMLQRVGRTGRKRAGRVEVLLSEAREEDNWDRARRDYESVQTSITRGESLELFADVDRLLPYHIKPKPLEQVMPIEEYIRDTKPSKASGSGPKGTKRKRNADVARNIPEGAVNGFISSSKLISKRDSKKRKVAPREYDPDEVDDDDDDLVIQAGIHGSTSSKPKGNGKNKAKTKATAQATSMLRKKTEMDKARSKKTVSSEMTLSQLDREVEDDTDDMEIELGIRVSSPERPLVDVGPSERTPLLNSSASPISIHSSPEPPLVATQATLPNQRFQSDSMEDHSWLLDSDDDVKVIEEVSPSAGFCQSSKLARGDPTTPTAPSGFRRSPMSHILSEKRRAPSGMLPPPVPAHAMVPSDTFPSTFAIRRPGVRRKRPQVSSSPIPAEAQISSPAAPPPRPPVKLKGRRGHVNQQMIELLDIEAQVSGDETMSGSSDHEEVESESDRRFVEELPSTQASPNYNQTLAYRHSLFTQAPGRSSGPLFASRPVRRGAFGPGRQKVGMVMSSSPTRDEAPDQYSMDSFVVEDDDDILLHEGSHSSGI